MERWRITQPDSIVRLKNCLTQTLESRIALYPTISLQIRSYSLVPVRVRSVQTGLEKSIMLLYEVGVITSFLSKPELSLTWIRGKDNVSKPFNFSSRGGKRSIAL